MANTKTTARKTKTSTIASLTRKRTFTLDVDHEFLAQLIDSGSEDTRADWIKLENLLKKPRIVPADLIPELLERARMVIECSRFDPANRNAEDAREEMRNVAKLLYGVCEWVGLTGKLDMTEDPTIAADDARRAKEKEAKIRREEYERKEWETHRNQVKTA